MTDPEERVPSTSETAKQQMGAEHGSPAAARSAGATGATTNTSRTQSSTVTSAQGRASPDAIAAAQALMRSSRPSRTSSPMTSRESSPARLPPRAHSAMSGPVRRVARSRKNSIQEQSPHRPPALSGVGSTPSAAAIQRALASASTSATVADPAKTPRQAQKPTAASGDSTPHWPISPRIKSPPPPSGSTRSRRNSQRSLSRRPEISSTTSAPNIVLQRAQTPNPLSSSQQLQPQQQQQRHDSTASDSEDQGSMIMKAPGRAVSGTGPMLETVQEGSLPTTPGFDILALQSHNSMAKPMSDDAVVAPATDVLKEQNNSKARESGNESGGSRTEDRGRRTEQKKTSSSSRNPPLPSRNSFTGLVPTKSRSVTEPSKNMTVETETVRSIPQAPIGLVQGERVVPGRAEPSGSLRLKASNETIRPKKDRKKTVRKAPSIVSGTGRYHHVHTPQRHQQHAIVRPDSRGRSNTTPTMPSSFNTESSIQSFLAMSYQSQDNSTQSWQSPPSIPRFTYTANADGSPRKASSKADIFEAKVASAVDEANSSDSDETFVYESNPPDTQPHVRHHSRTPSVNSMASLAETSRGGFRPVLQADPPRSVAGKRSMKFANNPYHNSNLEDDTYDRPDGSMRSNHVRPSGSHSVHHHHIGRYGRNNMVSGLFEDAALPQPKSRSASGYASRHGSAPSSPKFPHYATRHGIPSSRKIGELSAYDMDGEGADDERTPLIGTVRSSRNRTMRPRPNSASLRHLDHYERSRGGCLRQFAGCFVLTIMVLLLAFGAVGFLFATTKPLRSVQVREIQNVLASEQEIMLDLLVEAINPNIVAVTIADMDVNIFAKSKHVGTDSWWREHEGLVARSEGPSESRGRRQRKSTRSITSGGGEQDDDSPVHALDDDPHDPIEDPSGDSQTMLLGRIFHFDSPLLFEGDPLQRRPHSSIGELRLQKPGNKTEAGGTERWERVIQYPFELIVRGILRYQLPLSSSTHTAPIGASVIVHPEKGVGESGHMWIEPIPYVAAEEDDAEWVEVEVVPVNVEKGSSVVDPPPPPRPAADA